MAVYSAIAILGVVAELIASSRPVRSPHQAGREPRAQTASCPGGGADSVLITGAGFGVLATEAVVAELCADRSTPTRVRVDARLTGAYTPAAAFGPEIATAAGGTFILA